MARLFALAELTDASIDGVGGDGIHRLKDTLLDDDHLPRNSFGQFQSAYFLEQLATLVALYFADYKEDNDYYNEDKAASSSSSSSSILRKRFVRSVCITFPSVSYRITCKLVQQSSSSSLLSVSEAHSCNRVRHVDVIRHTCEDMYQQSSSASINHASAVIQLTGIDGATLRQFKPHKWLLLRLASPSNRPHMEDKLISSSTLLWFREGVSGDVEEQNFTPPAGTPIMLLPALQVMPFKEPHVTSDIFYYCGQSVRFQDPSRVTGATTTFGCLSNQLTSCVFNYTTKLDGIPVDPTQRTDVDNFRIVASILDAIAVWNKQIPQTAVGGKMQEWCNAFLVTLFQLLCFDTSDNMAINAAGTNSGPKRYVESDSIMTALPYCNSIIDFMISCLLIELNPLDSQRTRPFHLRRFPILMGTSLSPQQIQMYYHWTTATPQFVTQFALDLLRIHDERTAIGGGIGDQVSREGKSATKSFDYTQLSFDSVYRTLIDICRKNVIPLHDVSPRIIATDNAQTNPVDQGIIKDRVCTTYNLLSYVMHEHTQYVNMEMRSSYDNYIKSLEFASPALALASGPVAAGQAVPAIVAPLAPPLPLPDPSVQFVQSDIIQGHYEVKIHAATIAPLLSHYLMVLDIETNTLYVAIEMMMRSVIHKLPFSTMSIYELVPSTPEPPCTHKINTVKNSHRCEMVVIVDIITDLIKQMPIKCDIKKWRREHASNKSFKASKGQKAEFNTLLQHQSPANVII